jgi:hypothetical protein
MTARRAFALPFDPTAVMTEADIERDIMQYLALCGYWTMQTHSGKRRPVRRGAFDITFGKGAVWGCIEVKGEDGILSDAQIEEMRRVERAGGRAIEAHSVKDVADAIDAAGRKT